MTIGAPATVQDEEVTTLLDTLPFDRPVAIPNLAGVATQDLVEKIGTGSYAASYINWSRTLQLLRTHAPGWLVECVPTANPGELVHRAPVGGYLLIRFRHWSGAVTPEVPQAIMDNRNNAIPYEKITARDVTDTHRRGACLAAAMIFGLAHELWAKMPLESGFAEEGGESTTTPITGKPTRESFLEAARARGLVEEAARDLADKLKGKFETGLKTLNGKDQAWVDEYNAKFPKPSGDGQNW